MFFAMPLMLTARGIATVAKQSSLGIMNTVSEVKTVYFNDFFNDLEQRFNVRINYDAQLINLATVEAPAINNLSKGSLTALLNRLLLPHELEAEKVDEQFYVVKPKGTESNAAHATRSTDRQAP